MLNFKSTFSLLSYTFFKRLFSSSSLLSQECVLFACGRLLFLPEILIPAFVSSSLEFHMMYSAYTLNQQGDNVQLWHTPFLIWNQSAVPCLVLNVASWPAYRFLCKVRLGGLMKNFSQSAVLETFDFNQLPMPLGYVILSKVVPCPLPSCFMFFLWDPSGHTVLRLQSSGGITRK